MNKDYIAGFFDADGYITMLRNIKGQEKVPFIGFTNNVKSILEDIQEHIYLSIGVKGSIFIKKARKDTYQDSYDLRYQGFTKTIKVLSFLPIRHPKKVKRFQIIKDMDQYIPRNGRYKEGHLEKRREKCEEFLTTL